MLLTGPGRTSPVTKGLGQGKCLGGRLRPGRAEVHLSQAVPHPDSAAGRIVSFCPLRPAHLLHLHRLLQQPWRFPIGIHRHRTLSLPARSSPRLLPGQWRPRSGRSGPLGPPHAPPAWSDTALPRLGLPGDEAESAGVRLSLRTSSGGKRHGGRGQEPSERSRQTTQFLGARTFGGQGSPPSCLLNSSSISSCESPPLFRTFTVHNVFVVLSSALILKIPL